MKIAILTIAYQEAEYIRACIKNWDGVVDRHLVLVSTIPWNGEQVKSDGTFEMAKEAGAEVIGGAWKTEEEQRSWGMARLYDYDYVLIVDVDELYTKEDQQKILAQMENPYNEAFFHGERKVPMFLCDHIVTYWKTHQYRYSSEDKHKPVIAVDPKQIYCYKHREFKYFNTGPVHNNIPVDFPMTILGVTCHHFAFAKSDAKVKEKIQSFSHSHQIKDGWYKNVWEAWNPLDETNVRPYGVEDSYAVYGPAPEEIVALIETS